MRAEQGFLVSTVLLPVKLTPGLEATEHTECSCPLLVYFATNSWSHLLLRAFTLPLLFHKELQHQLLRKETGHDFKANAKNREKIQLRNHKAACLPT